MQRWFITTALGLAAMALAVSLVRTPSQPAQATQVAPVVEATPAPILEVAEPPAQEGVLSRASMDHSAHRLGSSQERFLVVEVRAPETVSSDRQPLHLAVVVDSSGSMGQDMDNAKRAAASMVQRLGPQDSFSLVGFSDEARVVIPSQSVWDRDLMVATIQTLSSGGNTNLHAGLAMGVQQLQVTPSGNRRLVLLSDGMVNRGVTDQQLIARAASNAMEAGITTSALGLGVNFDGDLLHDISDAGGGSYLYAGRSQNLVDSFDAELDRAFAVAAKAARVEVSLDPRIQVLEVYGYEEWDGKATDDGFEAFLGDLCADEIRKVVLRARVPADQEELLSLAQVRVRWQDPTTGELRTDLHDVTLQVTDEAERVRGSKVPWATMHASTAEVGRHMQWANEAWSRGDRDEAQEILRRGEQRLSQLTTNIRDPRVASLSRELQRQQQRYASTPRNSWEGDDLRISEGLRALGYLN
jgi:Ca-activated chloride channel family protein